MIPESENKPVRWHRVETWGQRGRNLKPTKWVATFESRMAEVLGKDWKVIFEDGTVKSGSAKNAKGVAIFYLTLSEDDPRAFGEVE